MSGHDAGAKDFIDVCEDRLDIEFHNLCYYPSGKKGESVCVPPTDYQACRYDRSFVMNRCVQIFIICCESNGPSDFIPKQNFANT